MGSLKLFGGCIYCNALLKNSDDSATDTIKENPFADYEWDKDTILRINFKDNLSGSNFDGSFGGNVSRFKIYKTFSEQPEFHKVFESDSNKLRTVEDFTVGSACPYTYYIAPVCIETANDGSIYETIGSLIKSNPITLNDGTVRIIGLIQDDDDYNKYYIDTNNIWHFSLNMNDSGFTDNMAKTYTDTLSQFQKEIKGNGEYITLSIEGLLGKYDCEKQTYIDTYDDIVEWRRFMNNDQLKLVIDLRGMMIPGSIESNSFQYEETGNHEVSVNFGFRQLDDINKITIINKMIPCDPTKEVILTDKNGQMLMSNDPAILTAKEG